MRKVRKTFGQRTTETLNQIMFWQGFVAASTIWGVLFFLFVVK